MRNPLARLLCVGLAIAALLLPGLAAAHTDQPPIDRIIVLKSERTMLLFVDGLVVKHFHIDLGARPIGAKRQSGDERTPEGNYVIDWRNPHSRYYLSFHISYPDARDRARARAHSVDPGSNIMIHGQPNYAVDKRTGDWTDGCIAVSDAAMDILWRRVPVGTPIEIYP